jgi:tetratricopeptide (TPR) repeat protein
MADTARIEELRRRVQLDPASIAFASLAEEYRRAGQFDEAIATCEAGLQRHPAYVSARVTLGRCLLETGRFDEARAALEQVLQAAPENLAAIRGLAEIHHRAGDQPETAQSYAFSDPEPAPSAPPPAAPPPAAPPDRFAPIALSGTPAAAPPAAAPPLARPHPDEAALPALESFLAAIVAVRSSARRHTI